MWLTCWRAWSRWTGDGRLTQAAVAAVIRHNDRVESEKPVIERVIGARTGDLGKALRAHAMFSQVRWRYDPVIGHVVIAVHITGVAEPNFEGAQGVEARLGDVVGVGVVIQVLGTYDGYRDESIMRWMHPWPETADE